MIIPIAVNFGAYRNSSCDTFEYLNQHIKNLPMVHLYWRFGMWPIRYRMFTQARIQQCLRYPMDDSEHKELMLSWSSDWKVKVVVKWVQRWRFDMLFVAKPKASFRPLDATFHSRVHPILLSTTAFLTWKSKSCSLNRGSICLQVSAKWSVAMFWPAW